VRDFKQFAQKKYMQMLHKEQLCKEDMDFDKMSVTKKQEVYNLLPKIILYFICRQVCRRGLLQMQSLS